MREADEGPLPFITIDMAAAGGDFRAILGQKSPLLYTLPLQAGKNTCTSQRPSMDDYRSRIFETYP